MNKDQLIQLRYAELCRELGHLQSNKSKVDKRMQEIAAEIDALDKLAAMVTTPHPVKEPTK